MSTRREFLTQTAIASLVAAASAPSGEAATADPRSGSKTPLKTCKVPHTDLVVSRIAFGNAMLGIDWKSADFVEKTVPVINSAYDHGITFFDTADIYGFGKAETALGEVLKQSTGLRQRIVIQSKCTIDIRPEGDSYNQSREHIVSSVEGSLKRLGTDHLDILLLHWPDSLVEPEEVARAFGELQASGKVRYFGVSNHSSYQIELLKKSVRQPLVANQIQLGLAHWYAIPNLLKASTTHGDEGVVMVDYCRVHDIQVQAYSPLRGGLLNPAAEASPEVKKAAQLLTEMAKKHNTTPAAVMLAWLLRHPAGIVPIIGPTKAEHVIEDCAADGVELSRVEWYSLLHAAAAIHSPEPA